MCFSNTYKDVLSSSTITDIMDTHCTASNIMIACRQTAAQETIKLLSWATRECVFTSSTGSDFSSRYSTLNCQGSEWYFSKTYSWGFADAGNSVYKHSCDTDTSGSNDKRLCWHSSSYYGGFRCGSARWLNYGSSAENYERLIFQRYSGGNLMVLKQINLYLYHILS